MNTRRTQHHLLVLAVVLIASLVLAAAATAAAPNKLVFQRGAGNSGQTISYWAGSSLIEGGGGPVPNFVNPPQPAWVDIPLQGSHMIEYASNQPIKEQNIFFNIITDNDKNNPVCVVTAKLQGNGTVTDASSNCAKGSQIVVKTYPDHVAVMLPSEIPTLPNQMVFQRGAGDSSQAVSYWAGSTLPNGNGGPVPNFVNPPQPAWIDLSTGGSHTITYAASQPADEQTVFFKVITDKKKDSPLCVVSAKLKGNGQLTDASSDCPRSSGIVVKTMDTHVAVMIPPSVK